MTSLKMSDFMTRLFSGRTKGNIFICSYANDRADAKKFPPRDMVTRRPDQIEKFLKQYDVAGRSCYFAVNTVRDRKRSKDEIQEINCLHVDLDFKGIVESRDRIIEVLKSLKHQPSAVIASGHGLHVYWLLQPALGPEHIGSIEMMLARLAEVLAGDKSAAEIARVLRLPGSHNSKNNEWLDVEVVKELCSWGTYSAGLLDKWLHGLEPLLTYKSTKKDAPVEREDKPLNIWQQLRKETRADTAGLDIEELLSEMTYGDTQGNGIDDTHQRIVGDMVRNLEPLSKILTILHDPTKRVYERDRKRGDKPWSDKEFKSGITAKFKWCTKRDAQKEDEASGTGAIPEAETKAPLAGDKKKLNGHKHDIYDGLPDEKIDIWGQPTINLFGSFVVPMLERRHVPEFIANVAFDNATVMGCDPGALAMALLTVVSGAISTNIKIKVRPKEHDTFIESARIWTMIVGVAGSKKSPMMREATRPLIEIDKQLSSDFKKIKAEWDAMSKDERQEKCVDKPVRVSAMLDDFSIESASDSLIDNPRGELIFCDEIRQFFGAVTRYANSKNGRTSGAEHSARAFLLKVFNSEWAKTLRMSREEKTGYVSASVLGSIQPDLLHELAAEASHNDGLIQRVTGIFIPKEWIFKSSEDEDITHPFSVFHDLINQIYHSPLSHGAIIRFSTKAHEWRIKMNDWIETQYEYQQYAAPQFASALRKWEGMFARWCLIFYMIEHPHQSHAGVINEEIARRVFSFMTDYLFDHTRVLFELTNANDEHEKLQRIVLHCVVHELKEVTARDLIRATKKFDSLEAKDIKRLMDKLEALNYGRVRSRGKNNRYDSHMFEVNPNIIRLYKNEGENERQRLSLINSRWQEAQQLKAANDTCSTSHRKH